MAVVATNLTHGNNTAGVSSVATASITPTANQLLFAIVTTRTASLDPSHATATGNSLTWVEVLSINYDNTGSQKRLTVLRAMGASPTAGAVTFDFAAQTQTDIAWVIDTFTGMDTTGTNGSGAVVQTASNTDTSGTGTSLSCTLAAFGSANNATYGACAIGNKTLTFTPGSGFATTQQDEAALNGVHIAGEFRNNNSTTVNFTSSVAGELGVIGIEIKAAVVVTTILPPMMSMMGVGA